MTARAAGSTARPLPVSPARSVAVLRRLALAALAAAASAGAASPAGAQTVTPRCSAFSAAGCTALRFDIAASAGAPLALRTFDVQLTGDYTFAGGASSPFTGEDDFSFGTPFDGSARVENGRDLFVAFLTSPGFTFELGPGGAGYLEFALVAGADPGADFAVAYQVRDADDASVADGSGRVDAVPSAVVPEPATVALVAAGVLGLAAARRRAA